MRPPPCDFRFLLSQFPLFRPPARALAAETLKLERTLSDLADQAYALTQAEMDLVWQTAPPRMPIPPPGRFPATTLETPLQEMARPDTAGVAC